MDSKINDEIINVSEDNIDYKIYYYASILEKLVEIKKRYDELEEEEESDNVEEIIGPPPPIIPINLIRFDN